MIQYIFHPVIGVNKPKQTINGKVGQLNEVLHSKNITDSSNFENFTMRDGLWPTDSKSGISFSVECLATETTEVQVFKWKGWIDYEIR